MPNQQAADLPPALTMPMMEAVRIAARTDGAPSRCKRRACRRNGRCHAVLKDDDLIDCGGGISNRAFNSTSDMMVFLWLLLSRLERGEPSDR